MHLPDNGHVNFRFAGVVGALALLTSCAGAPEEPEATAAPNTSEAPTTTTTPQQESATTLAAEPFSVTDIQASTVRLIAEGSFVYPFEGAYLEDGLGSGFLFSSDGHVLTNNHVVTGAAILTAVIGDDPTEYNARILGVSECDDLAVVQLSTSTPDFLPIAPELPEIGTEVFAAGFPGDTDDFESSTYTLTAGILSSVNPQGESSWASVGEELEHDADIRGGNSGGPLVSSDGHVIGVNYAGDDELGVNYAISLPPKQGLIDQLVDGNSVTSLGINAEAMFGDETEAGLPGIWIYGVESGSPADLVGLEPGDLITAIEGLPASEDGTMETYCDIVRTRGADAATSIEVYRPSTDEFFAGQFNGEELALRSGLVDKYGSGFGAGTYDEFVLVTDDSGAIEVEIPAAWSDIDGAYDEAFGGPSIWASTNLDDFWDYYGVPGVAIDTTRDSSQNMYRILNEIDYSPDCFDAGIEDYDDGIYVGYTRLWTDCPDDSSILVLAALPESQRFIVRLEAQVVSDADLDALDRILSTFYVYED